MWEKEIEKIEKEFVGWGYKVNEPASDDEISRFTTKVAKDADDTENPATNNSPREDTSQNVNSSAENNIQNDDFDILYHEGLPADTLNSIILQARQSENVGYEIINNNVPFFIEEDITLASQGFYELYSELDDLGRCGFCMASIGQDLMPTEERESIGTIKPTGWVQNKYKGIISSNIDDPQYLYVNYVIV